MFKRKCAMCSKKTAKRERRFYLDERGERIIVCLQCAAYAERRAWRKAN